MTILVKDETFSGSVLHEVPLQFDDELVTIQEIITQRVTQEVKAYNEKLPGHFNGLVEPENAEKELNGYVLKNKVRIDTEKQIYIALNAFQKNGFFLLVDNVQSESLDQKVRLNRDTRISFIKLTPLVGG